MAPGVSTPAPSATSFPTPKNASRIQPDPELVQYPTFDSQPSTAEEFYKRAEQVGDLLHQDEAVRDRGNVVPTRQVQLLKDSGLVTLLGPKSAGGGGQTWEQAYTVIRIVARGDGSLAQLLGYHYIWFWAAALVGTDEQRTRHEEWLTKNRYFSGAAVNPRDSDLHVTEHPTDPTKLVFNGKKTFSTGSKISDVTILEGALPDGSHVFAPVLSKQDGIVYGDEWVDTLGMRGTQSGGITIKDVVVPREDALGYDEKNQFHPLGAYNTVNLPAIQLVFTSFYLGIAEGALKRGLEYTKSSTRGWPYTPAPVARGTDEFYIQDGYGTLQARIWASAAQIEAVVKEGSAILHTQPRQNVTAEQRALWAVHIAAAKLNITDFGLELTSKIYELSGARAVSGKYGFDLAWRDLRTHTLHDPIAHKRAEVGRFALHGPGADGWPTPSWYT
ncbi:unnamed protein product [Tilletia laevis]|uniref:Dibenzothiophene desulfurization enzyme C n=2 Tax=Tilletia TaxID=13289 RepID=A0A8X7MU08_9BASI|nr:hypothetical protein CF328_g3383 [Tilletia controversa]KAE8203570.1 hypothetical protein CF335_g2972 [Tilletia laevis]CAD6893643.1 unnamed protein product [Tilletia caries]KAE8247670.1 hypothetical protein A4X06_0g4280 [Tilletia controversa]CAD6900510.1 unnamed protein product [Tilletia laevis]